VEENRRTKEQLIRENLARKERVAELEANDLRTGACSGPAPVGVGHARPDGGGIIGHAGTVTDASANRQAEAKGKELSAAQVVAGLAENTIEFMADGLFLIDEDGRIIFFNKALERITGYRKEEVLGALATDLFPKLLNPEELEKAFKDIGTALQGEEIPPATFTLTAKDGRNVPILVFGAQVRDEEGNVTTFASTVKDISELKQAVEALRDSETRLEVLSRASFEAIFLSEKGVCLDQNQAAERMFGYTRAEAVGRSGTEWIVPEDREMVKNNMLSGYERPYEATALRKDGTTFPCEMQARMTDYKGHSIRVTALRDITERRCVEEALRDSEEKYRFLAENMADIVWTVDLEVKTTFVSSSIEKVLGFTPEERKRQSLDEIMTAESSHRVMAKLQEELLREEDPTADPDRSLIIDIQHYRKDGSTLWMENTVKALRDPAGAIVGIYGVSRDISERKRAEEEKEKLRAQLLQAQKMESIGTMAGGIAHDFNNILAIIIGNTEMAIKDVPEWNQGRKNLDEVIKASLRARDMVKQILAFSRQTEQEQKPMRLRPIVEDSLRLIRSTTPTTIEIRQDLNVRTDTVLGDPTQVSQILMNLCTNATHAMREKGGVLEVSLGNTELDPEAAALHQDLPAGEYVALTVSDSGHGMGPETLARIFDPYFTTKGVGEGSGMGLSVVHGIVKNHGGAIRAESGPGKGTSFEVLLPLLVQDVEPASVGLASLPTGSEHVLFVDDEEGIADLGGRMLQHLGYQVTVRTSSREALEVFEAQPEQYDLLVTDMTMPTMTGMDLSRELLRIRPGLPIVLCTGFSDMVTEDSAKQMGIEAFVMKPLVMREIAETVRRILDKQ